MSTPCTVKQKVDTMKYSCVYGDYKPRPQCANVLSSYVLYYIIEQIITSDFLISAVTGNFSGEFVTWNIHTFYFAHIT